MSRWPIFKTAPAPNPERMGIAIAAAIVAVLTVPIALGYAINIAASAAFGPDATATRGTWSFGLLLIISPFLSWVALIVMVPLSIVLGRRGYAGWGAALLAGAGAGMLADLAMNAGRVGPEVIQMMCLGILLALIYWLTIRWISPSSLGIPVGENRQ